MHGLTAWKENEINRLRKDLDAIFKRRCQDFGIPLFVGGPEMQLDLSESDAELILTADIAGFRPEDIEISASEDSITIEATSEAKKVTENDAFQTVEARSSTIRRRLSLPVRVRVEEIRAEYENQRLKIVMPKCDPSRKRSIKLQIR
jgi:HSP20 family protein